MLITLPIREVLPATPRARIVRLGLGGVPFPYEAGQAVLVGTHGREPRRPYSIAASPQDARRDGWLELLVGLDETGQPGPHLTLEPGSSVDVEGPFGTFTFPSHPVERRFLFIAGGTGIAPLRAMVHHALQIPHDAIGVFYSARTPDDFAYKDELQALERRGKIWLRLTVTRSGAKAWNGARGRIGRAGLQPFVQNPATLCFVCGPPALVHELPRLLRELGIGSERIRIEEWA